MMFWRKKTTPVTTDLSWLVTDMHSHLLPDIDDGSPATDVSLQLIRGLQDLGFQKLITTPHILSALYPNTPAIIGRALGEVKAAAAAAALPVDLHAAAEYFIDDSFHNLLREKTALLTLSDNLVLVEVSMVTTPLDLQEVIFELQLQNYQPVIAHPERYIYLSHKKEYFDSLKDAGCYFQLNLLSLVGHYGTSVQDLAEYLIKKGYYDLAGTDLHHLRHLEALRKLGNNSALNQLRDSGVLKNHEL